MITLPENKTLRSYVFVAIALAAVAVLTATIFGGSSSDLAFLSLLVLAGAVSERFKVSLFGDSHVSLSAFAIMVAAVIGGARDAIVVAAVLAVAANVGGRVPAYKTAFNVAAYVLSALSFVAIFDLLSSIGSLSKGPYLIVPATLAAMGDFAVNTLLIAGAVAFASQRSIRAVIQEKYLWLAPHYLPLGVLLYVSFTGYESIGVTVVPVLAMPVAGIQLAVLLYSSLKRSSDDQIREVEERIKAVQTELARAQMLIAGRPAGRVA
jgi:hypothetical protein